MGEDDFYADPTVFDQWQYETGNWCCSRIEMLRPYAWLTSFAVLGLIFLCTALGVCLHALQSSLAADIEPLWNQLLAQGVTVVMALIAAHSLFRQAVHAWPDYIQLPDWMARIARLFRPQQAARPGLVRAPAEAQKPSANVAVNRQAVQEFFSGVRAAGINVAIAKALFAAGVRSAYHLSRAPDHYLHSIHGVGPATVRKLRAYFRQQQLQSASCPASAR